MSNQESVRVYEDVLERIRALPVIDTHEHLVTEGDFVSGRYDFGHIMTYTGLDLGLAGMPHGPWGDAQWRVLEGDPEEKWRLIAPYWARVRNTRYARCSMRALKRYFGVEELTERSAREVTERIKDYQYPGVYRRHLQEEDGIRLCVRCGGGTPEPEYFRSVCYLDDVVGPITRSQIEQAAQGASCPSFESYVSCIDRYLDEAKQGGAVCLKIGWTARRRPLDFCEQTTSDVEEAFRFVLENERPAGDAGVMERLKPFHDAAYWHAFAWARDNGLPVQVHSGLEFEQPWDGRPTCLIPTLVRFRDTRFAIFHGSYPYLHELAGLARSYANVTLDLAWLHLLSGRLTAFWLDEWIDILPLNKIMAFGGDSLLFFEVGPHLDMAREVVAEVLTRRVGRGECDLDEAVEIARVLFHESPREYFRLGDELR